VFQVTGDIAPRPAETKEPAGEPFRLEGFDVGSEWLQIVAAAPFVLSFLSRFWAKAIQIASFQHYRNALRQQEAVLKIAAEHAKAGEDNFRAVLSAMSEAAIHELRGEAPPLDPETHQRAVQALKVSADAIERGARLTLAASAPAEAAQALPSLEEQEKLVAAPSIGALPAKAEPNTN